MVADAVADAVAGVKGNGRLRGLCDKAIRYMGGCVKLNGLNGEGSMGKDLEQGIEK